MIVELDHIERRGPRHGFDRCIGLIAFGAILLLVIPWGYVWRHYIKEPSARWR